MQTVITPTDPALTLALTRMRNALDGLLSTRAVTMPLPSKMPLAVELGDKLEPVLKDIYWHPLRNGINEAPEDDDDLRAWLHRQLSGAAVWAALLALLIRYYRRTVNYGGEIALDVLGLSGTFSLTNAEYLAQLDERATMLTSANGDINLIDQTVSDLSVAIPTARNSDDDTLAVLGGYIAGRALTRGVGIATYEAPWGFNRGLGMTYRENKIKQLMYDLNGAGCPEICAPLHGRTFPADNVPDGLFVPQHPNCDCIHRPLTDNWTRPDEIWRGE